MEGDEETQGPVEAFIVRRDTLKTVVEGLETYSRYLIFVSGFTRFGGGDATSVLGGITLQQNWFLQINAL